MTNLASKARSAVIWNTGFNLFRDLLQFVTMLVLVRIVAPQSYGEFALVNSVIGLLSVFSHNGFMAYLLQVSKESEARYQEQFSASAFIQGAMFLITNAVAIGLRYAPTYAPITPFVHVMSLTFLLEWPCELRRKMLERQFDWQTLRLLHATGLIAGAILAVSMAGMGAGTYALLIPGLLSTAPFIIDLFLIQNWRPTWAWSWQSYRPTFRFGISRMASGAVVGSRMLMESSVLTAVVGFATLGVFNRSIGLAQMFCIKFASQLLYAIYPLLTRVDATRKDSNQVGSLVLRFVAWVVTPIATVLAQLGAATVHFLYGDKWEAAVPLLPFAMMWGALSAISGSAYMLLLSRNQTRRCLLLDIGALIGTGIALMFALPHGLLIYFEATVALQVVTIVFLGIWLIQSEVLSGRGAMDAFVPPILCAAGTWVLVEFGGQSFSADPMRPNGVLCWGSAFALSYIIMLRIGFRRQLLEIVKYLPANKSIALFLRL